MRQFESGATRDDNANKHNFVGFLAPEVLNRYARYMHRHRQQADGNLRAADNWKKGIPRQAYMESMFRHFIQVWDLHQLEADGEKAQFDSYKVGGNSELLSFDEAMDEAICALLFNVMGYMYEQEKGR